jgi:type IV pilus assembly protein PilB
VQDGVVEESAMLNALQAAKDRKSSFVTQLIAAGAAKARDIAIAASSEFGVPLYDLDSHQRRASKSSSWSRTSCWQKHRCLPLFRRGQAPVPRRWPIPPTCTPSTRSSSRPVSGIEAVVVEDDKLQKAIDKAAEQADAATPLLPRTRPDSISRPRRLRGDDDADGGGVSRDDVEDAPIVRFVNKLLLDAIRRGASDIHFEPYEKMYRIRLRMDGILKEVAQPPVQLAMKLSARIKVMSRLDIAERRVPQDGRIKMKLSKTRAIDFRVSTCPTAVRREDRLPYSRSVAGHAGHRLARLRAVPARDLSQEPGQAAGHDPGHRTHGLGQDRVAVHRPQHPQQGRHQHLDRGRPGGNQSALASTRSTSTTRSASPSPRRCAPSCARILTW